LIADLDRRHLQLQIIHSFYNYQTIKRTLQCYSFHRTKSAPPQTN
jgi:hypothetical protein